MLVILIKIVFIKAETIITEFLVKINLPISAANKFIKVVNCKGCFSRFRHTVICVSEEICLEGLNDSKSTAVVKELSDILKDEFVETF